MNHLQQTTISRVGLFDPFEQTLVRDRLVAQDVFEFRCFRLMLDAHGFEELAIIVQFVGKDLHVGSQWMCLVDQIDLMCGRETSDAVPDPFGQIADAHLFDDVARIVDVRQGFIQTLADVQVVERFGLLLVCRTFRVAENDTFELLDQQVEFQLAQIDEITWSGRRRRERTWRRQK